MALDVRGFYVWSREGGGVGTRIALEGKAFGSIGDGMLGFHTDFFGDVFSGVPIMLYNGADGVEVSGLPDYLEGGVPFAPFHTYAGVAFNQSSQTAICGAFGNPGGEGVGNYAKLYRSTDRGMTWTEVHEWSPDIAFKGKPMDIVYNGQTTGSWWVNGGTGGSDPTGAWHSTDDGLTWHFVDTDTLTPDQTPSMSSAGRNGRAPV